MNPLLVQEAAAALLGGVSRTRGLFGMIIIGVLIFAGLGYYLDWYKIQRNAGPDGQQNITIGVNTNEIKKDWAIVKDRAGQIIAGKPIGYPAPTQPTYPGYPQQPYPTTQNGYPPAQYPTSQYPTSQYPTSQYPTAQYPNQYPQTYPQQQQPGYYPPASGYYPPTQPQPQGNWRPTQPATPTGYPQGSRPF